MPTPFQHLVYADRVLSHPALPSAARESLTEHLGAFLLGTTAADVQVITGQPRVETHFYRIATGPDGSPVDRMLATFDGASGQLSPAHAAFLAGYAVHLVWDELWAWDIFVPYYRDGAQWPDRTSFFVHHNALRVWLDRQAYAQLQVWPDLVACLRDVVPDNWLPFAPDSALGRWRDWLVAQVADPALVQTAQVFAERMQVPVEALEALVREMAADRYAIVPGLAAALVAYETTALAASVGDLGVRIPDLCAGGGLARSRLTPPTGEPELRNCDSAPMLTVALS